MRLTKILENLKMGYTNNCDTIFRVEPRAGRPRRKMFKDELENMAIFERLNNNKNHSLLSEFSKNSV
jgi:hypothetical protein